MIINKILKNLPLCIVKGYYQKLLTSNFFWYIVLITYDALPTPCRTQMWVQVKDNGRSRSRDALPSSQHFEG
jgi:hypothetical protein